MRAVILNALQTDRRGFHLTRWIRVLRTAGDRTRVDAFVSDFVRNNERALRFFADILGEYRPALVVEDSACAFERGITRWKASQFKLEMLDCGTYQLHRLLG